MRDNKCIPSIAILINGRKSSEEKLLNQMDVDTIYLSADNINDEKILNVLMKRPEEIFIYTGGGIVKKRLLSIKKFIHIHPGIVPEYRGSTCFYYSILNNFTIGMSAIYLSDQLDKGDILAKKNYPVPKVTDMDSYIPKIRAKMLKEVLTNKLFLGTSQDTKGNLYYIIHPVLKHIAILKATSYDQK